MPYLKVSLFYAGFLALMLIYLSLIVVLKRRKTGIVLFFADDKKLAYTMRAQANFVEYTPIFLLLMFLLELSNVQEWMLHSLGIVFVLGRMAHAYSLIVQEQKISDYKFRVAAMIMTFVTIGVSAVYALILWLQMCVKLVA